ncbi:MAG TPA: acyl-CoA desaturase [Candidatus Limnocylindrales bacterium]|nr:acyl-CoA desaturase [Candidatus Limnocylindrales bacterium]
MSEVTKLGSQAKFKTPSKPSEFPGIAMASLPAQKFERTIALVVVITPFLGFLAATILFWGYALGLVELGLLIGMYAATIIGIGVGFHRHFSHRAFKTNRVVRVILAILGSMAAQGPVLFWAAIHRRHHAYSDQSGDPHSPHLHGDGISGLLRGLWHAHTGWLFVHEVTDWSHYIPDLLRDTLLFKVNRLYFVWVFLGLLIPTLLGGILTGTWIGALQGFLWGGLIRTFLVHHTTWSVNSITHVCGTRPFHSRDESRNNFLIALLAFGEGWHNNHHAFPGSARHGLKWWQIDWNGCVIRILERIGLAWDVKVPTARMLVESRKSR